MKPLVRTGCAGCVALLTVAAAPSSPSALAQSPIDVQTIVSVPPPQTQGGSVMAPAPAAVAPWDQPQSSPAAPPVAAPAPAAPSPVVVATKPDIPSPSASTTAFTGMATPLPCRPGVYRAIIDERTELPLGTLCALPDGTWQLLP